VATTRNKQAVSTPVSTRERIEKEAITILSEKGYDATSMREIAEATGISKPVVYYHFKSKENLCHHLIRSGLDEFRRRFEDVCFEETEDPFEQIVHTVQVRFDFCKENVEFMRFIYALNFGPDRKKIDYDFYASAMEIFDMMLDIMHRASSAGVIKRGKEEAAVYYLQGIISAYVMLYIDGRGDFPRDLARMIVTDVISGLGA